MSVYQKSKDDLLDLFKIKVGVAFSESYLAFSEPKVNDNPAKTENTQIRISLTSDHPTHTGSEVFYYNRLDLARLASYPAPAYPPTVGLGVSVYTILTDIKNAMGLDFTQDDLVETFTVGTVIDSTVLLKAKPTSLGWIGEFTLPLGQKPLLSSSFVKDYIDWI